MSTSKPQPIKPLHTLVVSFLNRKSEKSCAPQEFCLILGNSINVTEMIPVLCTWLLHGIEFHLDSQVCERTLVQMWVIMHVHKKVISVHVKESNIQLSNIPTSLCSSCFSVSCFSPKNSDVHMYTSFKELCI